MKKSKQLVSDMNILEVEVRSNCPQGGDGGHGGVTVFRMADLASTGWDVATKDLSGTEDVIDGPASVEIRMFGDAEARTLLAALEFAAGELRQMLELNAAGVPWPHSAERSET